MTTPTMPKPATYEELADALAEHNIIRPRERDQILAATKDPSNKLYPYACNLLAYVAMLVNDALETREWSFDFTVALATWRCAVELA